MTRRLLLTPVRGRALLLCCIAAALLAGCQTARNHSAVVVLIESAPLNLDPRVGTDAQSARIGELIFDSLLLRDAQSQLQPFVATSWETPDPLTVVLHLRSDVRFHDGRPLTSRDVVYTLDSLISGKLKSLKAGSFSRVQSVQATDEQTVEIKLKEPYSSFLWNLTQGAFGIVPDGSSEALKDQPVGSGPFRFLEASGEDSVLLVRNPEYWGGAPSIQNIEFKVVPDATTRALELRKGSADIVVNALPADTVESLGRYPGLVVSQSPGNTYQYLGLNVSNPVLGIPVRQAIAYGIDRDELIKGLWRGLVRPADSVLPKNHWAHAPDLREYPYDPARAIALLEAAGYLPHKDGVRLRLELKTSTDQAGRELGAVIQDQLSKIGIQVRISSSEFATFYADISKGNFDLFSLRWIGGNEDPDIFDYVFHSRKSPPAGANRGRFNNRAVDGLIESARATEDVQLRRAAYARIQATLNEELPYIHLWYLDTVVVHRARVSGIIPRPDGGYAFLKDARIRAEG